MLGIRFDIHQGQNVLQHVYATMLRIELQAAVGSELGGQPGAAVRLRAVDNGRGFDPDRVKLAGLRSLRERAAMIGAWFDIVSVPGNTTVNIFL
jgi:signal transduction histidine kinase